MVKASRLIFEEPKILDEFDLEFVTSPYRLPIDDWSDFVESESVE